MHDVVIIGAGIVGAATALTIQRRYPHKKIVLLEKEPSAATHQTGRNSGVIHAGVYYPPDSLKAQFCRQGLSQTMAFCDQYNIPYLQCGKLLVATNDLEMQRMEGLFKRCEQNQLSPEYLDAKQLRRREPNISGKGAIWIKQTGIVDYQQITRRMLQIVQKQGANVFYQQQVLSINESPNQVTVKTADQQYRAAVLISCAGLMADRIIRLAGIKPDFQIIPFRGEYYQLAAKHRHIINSLIYPIPDPELPFLGVHLTRMIDGTITLGPNAVLAWQREGYQKTDFSLSDIREMLTFSGFWPLLRKQGRNGLGELKDSIFKSGYLARVQKYCPSLCLHDLKAYPSGIRAQAVSKKGELLQDFKFVSTARMVHVGNAPSPAATSALPIASAIVGKVEDKF